MTGRGLVVSSLSVLACSSSSPSDPAVEPATLALRFEEVPLEGAPTELTSMRFLPESDEFLAISRTGRVLHYRLAQEEAELLGSFELPEAYAELDCGLISLAFDPAFAENRLVYFGMCFSGTESGVRRYELDLEQLDQVSSSGRDVIRAGDPDASRPWHNVGSIGFDADGALWALFGDKTVRPNGQDPSNDLSALVRVMPRRGDDETGHDPVASNPFADVPGFSPNVVAYGLRSPWTGTYDSHGRWWIGDVGASEWEELNLVAEPGVNFGWADHEGDCGDDCGDTRPPLRTWSHSEPGPFIEADPEAQVGESRARVVWVGPEYLGHPDDPYRGALTGKVLYGDLCAGFVRAIEVNADGRPESDEHAGHLANATGWDVGPDGYIYAVTFSRCTTAADATYGTSRLYRAVLRGQR